MRIRILTVNHNTTPYAELLLTSLLHHHPDREQLSIVVLDNASADVDRLERFTKYGVELRQTGYTSANTVTTHGEILRDAVLARADFEAYLFVDCDVCFVADDTIGRMVADLEADDRAFAVQATWLTPDGEEVPMGTPSRPVSQVRESVRPLPDGEWSAPLEFPVQLQLDDRVHPFCALLRNDDVFRLTVEHLGLSPAMTQCERGGKWWDTLGLLTQVMKTHRRYVVRSDAAVLHFGNVSWDPQWAAEKAAARDRLLAQYRDPA